MKHILFALCLIALPASAEIINLGNGRYVDLPIMTQAEVDQIILEKQNALHNAEVIHQREVEALNNEIMDMEALKVEAVVTPLVDETVYPHVDETIYPDLNSGSNINW